MNSTKIALALAVVMQCGMATQAFAHANFEKKEAPAGSYQRLALSIPHGCSGKATDTVVIEIPEGINTVKPQPKMGWNLAITKGPLKKPIMKYGKKITERVTAVTWSGGHLENEFFDEFKITVKMPKKAGKRMNFAVTQKCDGDSIKWDQVAKKGEKRPARPAPSILLTGKAKTK